MTEYTVYICYRKFDDTTGSHRLFSQSVKIEAEGRLDAKKSIRDRITQENPGCEVIEMRACASHR